MNDAPVQIQKIGSFIYVSGAVQTGTGAYSWAAVKYNTSGVQQAVTISSGGTSGIEEVHDMVADASGNLYLAGKTPTVSNGYDYDIIKLDSNLVIQWEKTWDGADNLDDVAEGIKVDSSGNVFVTGYSTTSAEGTNYITQKYTSAGILYWTESYNDSLNGNDEARALVLSHDEESLFVTGFSFTDSLNTINYYTIGYDTSGTVKWGIPFDGAKHLQDKATNIAIDTVGSVIVTGESETAPGVFEYATVKYVEKQTINPVDFTGEHTLSSFMFYENKGQLIDLDSSFVPEIRYYSWGSSPAYYFKNDTMSMQFVHEDSVSGIDTLQRISLSFTNCNEHVRPYPLEQQENYMNYYLAHCPQGITEIYGNQKLVVHDLYDDIDLVYSSNINGMKYYFVVKPGGDPEDIRMQYTGANSTNLSSNILSIRGVLDTINYKRPFTYQINSTNDTILNSDNYADWHNYTGNKYGIDVHAYDSTKALIVLVNQGDVFINASPVSNQTLEWSTFFGGGWSDSFQDVNVTKVNGGVFACGMSSSNSIQAQAGTIYYPYSLMSNDALIAKFDLACVNKWIDFLGGGYEDKGTSIAADDDGDVHVVGITQSIDFPNTTTSGINYSLQGLYDGFYVEIKKPGFPLLCDSYIGGSGNDFASGIAIGYLGGVEEIYIVGSFSGTGSPLVNNGAYNQTSNSFQDAFIMKLNNSNTNLWCTLVGGTGEDRFTDIALRPSNGNPVMVGVTTNGIASSDICDVPTDSGFPFCDNGGNYYSQIYGGGGRDAWIAEFDRTNLALIWSTPFGGTDIEGCDLGTYIGSTAPTDPSLTITDNDDLYVAAIEQGDGTSFPLLNSTNGGVYNQSWLSTNSPGFGAFIARFNSNREQTWTSFLGGEELQRCNGLGNDGENVFITGSHLGATSTPPLQSPTDYCDVPTTDVFPICNQSGNNYMEITGGLMFIVSFDKNDNIIWSTQFGGGIALTATDIFVDNSKLYLIGTAQFTNTLWEYDTGTPVDYYAPIASGTTDATIARFDISHIVIGINEQNRPINNMYVYPNPSNDYIFIEFEKEMKEKVSISIIDPLGRTILSKVNIIPCKSLKLDIEKFAKGAYFINISSKGMNYYAKFMKQ